MRLPLSESHTAIEPFDPDTSFLLSREYESAVTPCSWPVRGPKILSPLDASQMNTDPSNPPEAKFLLCGEHVTVYTQWVCNAAVTNAQVPDDGSHFRSVLSLAPDTRNDPSDDHAIEWTASVCPTRGGQSKFAESAFKLSDHTRRVLSGDEEASIPELAGEKVAQLTCLVFISNSFSSLISRPIH